MLNRLFKTNTLEQEIADYDYLGKQIKALEKERQAVKDSLINSYFAEHPEYFDVNGCLLASYEEIARSGINQKLLESEQPMIFEQYKIITKYMKFTVK
jgi:hypothetical protein